MPVQIYNRENPLSSEIPKKIFPGLMQSELQRYFPAGRFFGRPLPVCGAAAEEEAVCFADAPETAFDTGFAVGFAAGFLRTDHPKWPSARPNAKYSPWE